MAKLLSMIILRLAIALTLLAAFGVIGVVKLSKRLDSDEDLLTQSKRAIDLERSSEAKARRALRVNLEREVTDFTVAEIFEQLPGEFSSYSPETKTTEWLRAKALLRQLGVLMGGEAIAEVLSRYDGEMVMIDPFSAMGVVFEGWLSADSAAAIAGFTEILESERLDGDGHKTMTWQGRQFKGRGKKGSYSYEIMQRTVLSAVATADPVRGLEIFREDLLPPDSPHLEAFGEGMGEGTDWMAFRKELQELVDWKTPSTAFAGHDGVITAVLKGWSRWDLDAALKWGFKEVKANEEAANLMDDGVIWAIKDRDRLFEWFEQNRDEDVVTDERVAVFAKRFFLDSGAEDFQRLLSLTEDTLTRVSILEVVFQGYGGWRSFSKAEVSSLIEAAQLSEEDEAKFLPKLEQLK